MGVDVGKMDKEISMEDLEEHGIEIVNVSGSFEIEGEFDRAALAEDLLNSEYDPEDHRNLIYRGEEAMILLPPGGRVSIVRATTPAEIRNGVTVALGFEQAEYEPEQFPGVIYRPAGGAVILIFSSGKIVITAAVTYKDVLDAYDRVSEDLSILID